jgi:cytochrome P450
MTSTALAPRIDLESFDFYGPDQYEAYDWLQREAPVYYYEPLDTWVVSRYEDVRYVGTTPELFSNTAALSLNMIRIAQSGAGNSLDRFFDKSGEMVITLDPPRHRQIKRTLTPAFNPKAVRALADDIKQMCVDLVDLIVPGEELDFVPQIAAKLPIFVAERVLGLEGLSLEEVGRWVDALEALTRVDSVEDLEEAAADFATMGQVLAETLEKKMREPGDDLFSLLLATHLDGEPLNPAVALSHVSTLISNGGTTRALLASSAGLLAEHPVQRAWIREDPKLLPGAIEEILRVAPPARGFSRLVVEDTELHGTPIKAGQYVYMLYAAANRDASVFVDPARFDIKRRWERLHVSFGFGTHSCLGQPLVRLEASALLRELLGRYANFEVAGERSQQPHVQLNAWSHLPMRFSN